MRFKFNALCCIGVAGRLGALWLRLRALGGAAPPPPASCVHAGPAAVAVRQRAINHVAAPRPINQKLSYVKSMDIT